MLLIRDKYCCIKEYPTSYKNSVISNLTFLIVPAPEQLHGTEYVQGADQARQADTKQDDVHQPEDKLSCLLQHVLRADSFRMTIIFQTLLRELPLY